LQSLAERLARTHTAAIPAAAMRVADAWPAWRAVATAWGAITTDTHGVRTPAVADASDLLLRLGRLAFDNPGWTPATRPTPPPRDLAELPPGGDRLAAVAAVHHAWVALAEIAAADQRAVHAAVRASRLHVPTRSLPDEDGYDIPRRFAPAMHSQVADLKDAYETAVRTSTQAATVLGAVAVELGAPTKALALARAAAIHQHAHGIRRPDDRSQSADQPTDPGPDPGAGPVAQAVMQLGPPDSLAVLRAAAIDRAARTLLTEAAQNSSHDATPSIAAPANWWLATTGEAAQLAAQNFPAGPAAAPANNPTEEPPNSALQRSRRPRIRSSNPIAPRQ